MVYPRCSEQITLAPAEVSALEALPRAAHQVEQEMACELEAGHPGAHLALGQAYSPDREVWVYWLPPARRDLVDLDADSDACPAEAANTENAEDSYVCDLPAGHPGRHTFDLEEAGGRESTPEWQAIMDNALAKLARESGS